MESDMYLDNDKYFNNSISNINFRKTFTSERKNKIKDLQEKKESIIEKVSKTPRKNNFLELPANNNLKQSNLSLKRKNKNSKLNKSNFMEGNQVGVRICRTFEIQQKSPSENPINLGVSNDHNSNNKSNLFDEKIETNKTRLSSKFEVKNVNKIKSKVKDFLENSKVLVIITIASVYALILSDLNTIIFYKGSVDVIFTIMSTIVFLLFFIEFILAFYARDNYNFTFFFWMDFISMLSMIVNIDWIVFPTMELISKIFVDDTSYTSPSMYMIMKSLSGAFRTTRITRLLNIIKTIRLIRLFRLYKNTIIKKRKMYLKNKKKISHSFQNKNEFENNIENFSENQNKLESESMYLRNREDLNFQNFSFEKADHITELLEKPYEDILSESKISERLSYSMSRLLIILIFLLLLIFLFVNPHLFTDTDLLNYNILVYYLNNHYMIYSKENQETNFLISNFLRNSTDKNYPIVNVTYRGEIIYENSNFVNYSFRYDEVNYIFNNPEETVVAYSIIYDNTFYALLNLLRMLYISFILGLMIVKLDEDSKTHALFPLENIMHMIQKISKDPIGSYDFHIDRSNENGELDIRELNHSKLSEIEKSEWWKMLSQSNYEVKMIEAAVIKISALLAIGFGEAGEPIIKHNLKPGTQQVDPMVKGRKKIAIFGFCNIRDFSIVNECLQERTMSFINQIANIVHTSVDLYTGAINKNIGDTFLCVWKFNNTINIRSSKRIRQNNLIENGMVQEKKSEKIGLNNKINYKININKEEKENNNSNENEFDQVHGQEKKTVGNNNDSKSEIINKFNQKSMLASKLSQKRSTLLKSNCRISINKNEAADRALLGYLNILILINKRKNMLMYSLDKDIIKKIPNYKIDMGFGLHIGWAIEGSIGSNHKIDASYLSPNVNISARLEAATKQYNVNILISGDLFELLSIELKELCRLIDIVTVKGSKSPLKLYTVDTNIDNITPSLNDQPNINLSENRRKYEEKKQKFNQYIEEYGSIYNYVKNKNSFRELLTLKRNCFFQRIFSEGINLYIAGNWKKAKNLLNQALNFDPFDGPTKVILDFIGKYNYKKPDDWKGYRKLYSK